MVTVVGGVVSVVFIVWLYYKSKTRRLIMNFIGKATEIITMYNMILEHMEDVLDDKIDWEGEFYDLHIKNDKREFLTEMQKRILEILEIYEKISRKKSYNTIKEVENYYYYELVEKTKEEIYQLGYKIKMEIWRNGWN